MQHKTAKHNRDNNFFHHDNSLSINCFSIPIANQEEVMRKPFYQNRKNWDKTCRNTKQEKYGVAIIVALGNFGADIKVIGEKYKN